MRASFIMWNMMGSPAPSSPMIQARQRPFSPKLMVQVGDPFRPILCSMPAQATSFPSPGSPLAPGRSFGTRKRLMPLKPFGAPGVRASTRCTWFSHMSCSPAEMKLLVPERYQASPSRLAMLLMSPSAEPACGSVRHMVPCHFPESSLGT